MKILHLIDSGGLYGAEKMLLSLVQQQVKQGLEPMILSAGEPNVSEKPIEVEATRLGLPILAWRMKPGLNIAESSKILEWARSNHYDILHSHGFKFNVLLGGRPLIIRRIPMIATLHGYVHAKKFSKMWLYEVLDRFAIGFVQRVVLVGEAMKKELPSRLAKSRKVSVVPNGLDVEAINIEANRPLAQDILDFVACHSPIVLGVGRLSQEKGFDRLIDAFPIVCNEFENPGLIIVGEGIQKPALTEKVNSLGMPDKVYMPGYCHNVPGLQRRSDLLVIPSLTEGLPITLLEAMAVGVPVLVSPVGEMPSVIGYDKGGYLMPSDCEPEQLAALIVQAFHDERSAGKVEWALRKVNKSCSVEAMEKCYRRFYLEILESY